MSIYALSSGPGVSGVAVIRISGSETSKVIKKLTNKEIPQPRMATLRKINNINTSELIDEGIIIWFPGPESYTGEDMAEIHVHGGKAVVLALQNEISNINKNINTFVQRVNSSAVTVNASTRFNDGGEIGLGSEIAISTTKVSPRGPLGLEEITTYKWLIKGKGHTRV